MTRLITLGFLAAAGAQQCESLEQCRPGNFPIIDLWGGRVTTEQFNSRYIYDSMSSATTVLLYDNGLTRASEGLFHPTAMANVENLDLHDNLFTSLPADMFTKLPKLKILSLEKNKLRTVDQGLIAMNPLLEELYLQDNELVTIPSDLFKMNTKLKTLELSGNVNLTLPHLIMSPLVNLDLLLLNDCPNMELPMDLGLSNTAMRTISLRMSGGGYKADKDGNMIVQPGLTITPGVHASFKTMTAVEVFIDQAVTCAPPADTSALAPTPYPTFDLSQDVDRKMGQKQCIIFKAQAKPSNFEATDDAGGSRLCAFDTVVDRNETEMCRDWRLAADSSAVTKIGLNVKLPVDWTCNKDVMGDAFSVADIRGANPACVRVLPPPTDSPTMRPTTGSPTYPLLNTTNETKKSNKNGASSSGPVLCVAALVALSAMLV